MTRRRPSGMPWGPLFSLDAIRGSELKLCSVWGPCSSSVQGGHARAVYIESQERRVSEASAEYLPRAAPSLRVRFTQADKPVVRQSNRTDEEAVMRRIFVLALAALALLGVVTPDAFCSGADPDLQDQRANRPGDDVLPEYQQLRRRTSTSTTSSGMAVPAAASTSSVRSARPRVFSASRWTWPTARPAPTTRAS